ncbi:MAG: hypothetical protein ACOYM3_17050 [Terrimicrobiaceae bacterium]
MSTPQRLRQEGLEKGRNPPLSTSLLSGLPPSLQLMSPCGLISRAAALAA